MKISNIRYYFHEATKSISRNRLTSIASITTTLASLFILGVFIIFTVNINSFTQQFSRDCEIQVFIDDSVDAEGYTALGTKIKAIPHVSEAVRYTKEEIFEYMRGKLGEKAVILEGLEEDNPFRNSYKVKLDDLSYTNEVTDKLTALDGVVNVTDMRKASDIVIKISKTVRTVSLWLLILFCIISAFIMSNTIKVSVYSRRKEINIMKYIGATDWFVRWPFVIEGMLIGIIGAAISFAVIWIIYARIYASVTIPAFELVTFGQAALPLTVAFIALGIVIGAIGSMMALRKHLKV